MCLLPVVQLPVQRALLLHLLVQLVARRGQRGLELLVLSVDGVHLRERLFHLRAEAHRLLARALSLVAQHGGLLHKARLHLLEAVYLRVRIAKVRAHLAVQLLELRACRRLARVLLELQPRNLRHDGVHERRGELLVRREGLALVAVVVVTVLLQLRQQLEKPHHLLHGSLGHAFELHVHHLAGVRLAHLETKRWRAALDTDQHLRDVLVLHPLSVDLNDFVMLVELLRQLCGPPWQHVVNLVAKK